ncbi:GLUT4 regulating protein TUG domain containing protein [Naviculisporaceae sp. PSN 640]
MAAHVEVVSTDLRRCKVKVTPSTYLVDVLEEACQKLNLKSDNYLFKHKQRNVDLSCPFRTSGLVSGAKLELVRKSSSPSVVDIALQVEGETGEKPTQKLPSDMTLWKVLRQFEAAEGSKLNITARSYAQTSSGDSGSGQLFYEKPVVIIMGKKYFRQEELQKTLSQCGINSGRSNIQVEFEKTDQTLFDAMQQIDRYINDVKPGEPDEARNKPLHTEPVAPAAPAVAPSDGSKKEEASSEQTQPEPVPSPTADSGPTTEQPAPDAGSGDVMDVDPPTASVETSTSVDAHLQPTAVFSAPTSSTPAATKIYEDEAVYEPTIMHAQLRQQQLNQRAQNTRLKSDAELAADAAREAERLAKITKVEVKVRFPDQTSSQWEIHPDWTGSTLYQAVRGVMVHPELPFKLIMSVTRTAIQDNDRRLIAHYRLKGRELLNLVWEDSVPEKLRKDKFLKTDVAARAQEVRIPEVPQDDKDDGPSGEASSSKPPPEKKKGEHGNMDSEALKKKLGKLFKLPGKK